MEKLRRVLQRSNPSQNDLALLWGAIKQLKWAIDHLPRSDSDQ
jgi:tRNA C32,U32 (ribose-2'-O)-methylase TrmJ